VIAPDSFKECLDAVAVCAAIARGVRLAAPDCEIVEVPMADGGEGTVDAMVAAMGGEFVEIEATGPLGEPVSARYGLFDGGSSAVIEMAAASGLPLVPAAKRNPLITTTYGTGEMVRSALDHGARHLIIGIGGSATVDGGAGMAQALGVGLLDAQGREIGPGGGPIEDLASIRLDRLDPRIGESRIEVACDVGNPLVGPRGAARVYGPQKGATPEMVEQLDANLGHLADIVGRDIGADVRDLPGAGAAGGLGGGLVAFLRAELRSGVDIIIEAVGLAQKMAGASLVFTGEGRLDEQSAYGKLVAGVARAAKAAGVPSVALVGAVGPGAETILNVGLTEYRGIAGDAVSREESFARCGELLAASAGQAVRDLLAGRLRSGF